MDEQQTYQELKTKLSDREWRLNNLYYIKNKSGQVVKFKFNLVQGLLYRALWYLNVILKARQEGVSTFVDLFILDACLFNSNREGGIIDATLPDAKKKLGNLKFAYDHLPESLKNEIQLIKDNEQELKFSNGSRITADTTFRGATIQYLHISEYAKICKTEPIKADEIKRGALNAVAPGQFVFIESTAEDGEGDFYEICQRSEKLEIEQAVLTKLDYKFHFFPWWEDETYQLEVPSDYVHTSEMAAYFQKLTDLNIELSAAQKFWYIKKHIEQGEDMKKEYPSTSKEAFEAATDDKYYKEIINKIRAKNQLREFEIVQGVEIETDWDLGRSDYTSIIFSQKIGKELRIVDFVEDSGEALPFYIDLLRRKGYFYGKAWLPHDAANDLLGSEKNILQQVKDAGFKAEIVDKLSIEVGINEVRKLLPNVWFKGSTTARLIEHLEHYSKKWSEQSGIYVGQKHDEHSHAADAFRGLAVRYKEQRVTKDTGVVRYTKPLNSVTQY